MCGYHPPQPAGLILAAEGCQTPALARTGAGPSRGTGSLFAPPTRVGLPPPPPPFTPVMGREGRARPSRTGPPLPRRLSDLPLGREGHPRCPLFIYPFPFVHVSPSISCPLDLSAARFFDEHVICPSLCRMRGSNRNHCPFLQRSTAFPPPSFLPPTRSQRRTNPPESRPTFMRRVQGAPSGPWPDPFPDAPRGTLGFSVAAVLARRSLRAGGGGVD